MPDAAPDDFRLDFFCIGAPKARSTWLAQCLDEHPAVAVARIKENDFFVHRRGVFTDDPNPNYLKNWDWYQSLFEAAPADAVRGDFSIKVWRNPELAPRTLKGLFPDLKLVVTLRDPVRRLYSHYWYVYNRVRHWGGVPDTFAQAVADDAFVARSRYAERLGHWMEHFSRDRFRILTDLELDHDPLREIQTTYDFLGVDDDFVPPSLRTRVNPPKGRRGIYGALYRTSQALRRIGLGPVIDAAKQIGVERAINRIDIAEIEYPPLDPDLEQQLRDRLRPDIERLERMLGRDLTPWKDGTTADDKRLEAPRGETRLQMFQMDEV